MNKKITIWILLGILLLAFAVRLQNIDGPVVGYHNWKETHYLTEARNFARDGFFKHGFFVPAHDYPGINGDPSGAHPDTFPTTSIVVGVLFQIFGQSLVVARLFGVFCIIGAIFFAYKLVMLLFDNEYYALLTAGLMAFNPLSWFFSRSVQLINPALFFMVAGTYFTLSYIYKSKNKLAHLTVGAICLMLSILTKYYFALIVFPIGVIFLLNIKKVIADWKLFILPGLIGLLIPLWHFYTLSLDFGKVAGDVTTEIVKINFATVFSSEFLRMFKVFLGENFTFFGVALFMGGIFWIIYFLVANFKEAKNYEGLIFILAYFIITIPWIVVMAEKLQGHNYHQYPLILLFALAVGYLLLKFSVWLSKITSNLGIDKITSPQVYMIIFLCVLSIPSYFSAQNMYNVQFWGLEEAGRYIQTHGGGNVWFPSHQSYGVLWHADVKGYTYPNDVETMIQIEAERDVKWFFAYQWGLQTIMDKPWLATYLNETYNLVQAGTLNGQVFYYLFTKDQIRKAELFPVKDLIYPGMEPGMLIQINE